MRAFAAAFAIAGLLGAAGPAGAQEQQRAGLTSGQEQTLGRQQVGVDIVYDVQTQLRRLGYPVGPVDGIFGPNTRTALTQFQRDRGLDAHGRLDRDTLAVLGVPLQIAEITVEREEPGEEAPER